MHPHYGTDPRDPLAQSIERVLQKRQGVTRLKVGLGEQRRCSLGQDLRSNEGAGLRSDIEPRDAGLRCDGPRVLTLEPAPGRRDLAEPGPEKPVIGLSKADRGVDEALEVLGRDRAIQVGGFERVEVAVRNVAHDHGKGIVGSCPDARLKGFPLRRRRAWS